MTDLVVKQTGDDTSSVTSAGLGIAALLIDSGEATSITLGGPLILTAGALVTSGSSSVSITGGQIEVAPQSGTGPTELILNTTAGSSEAIDSPIISAGLPATATVTLANNSGQLFSISVTNGGYGYTTLPNVTISGGGGTGATATAVLNSTGSVTSINIVDPGSGYTSAPDVMIDAPPLAQATATGLVSGGSVQSISLTFGGQGYQNTPLVTLSAPQQPGGTQAMAHATMVNGVVTAITIDDPGSGYTSAPFVTIVPPSSVARRGFVR